MPLQKCVMLITKMWLVTLQTKSIPSLGMKVRLHVMSSGLASD